MIKFIKLASTSVALLAGATLFVKALGVAHAGDPSPLYPKKVVSNGVPVVREFGTVPLFEPYYGNRTSFPLKIVDQHGNPYPYGQAQETLWDSARLSP